VLDFGTSLDHASKGGEPVAASWSHPNLRGKGPSPRFDHTATWFPEKLVILGRG
jgi:dynein heavy chain